MLFETRDVVFFSIVAGVLGAASLYVWPWGRVKRRFIVGGVATFAGFLAWNLTLNHTKASGFNVDAPVIRASWADTGSGVLAFAAAALALAVYQPRESAGRVVGAAAICGALALILDVFVL